MVTKFFSIIHDWTNSAAVKKCSEIIFCWKHEKNSFDVSNNLRELKKSKRFCFIGLLIKKSRGKVFKLKNIKYKTYSISCKEFSNFGAFKRKTFPEG